MNNKLRLLMFEDCPRRCPGCCNKDWDLKSIPQIDHTFGFGRYNEVMLTGGEPMLRPDLIHDTIRSIRRTSAAMIYIYTAQVTDLTAAYNVLAAADGICVTLHEQRDVKPWIKFADTAMDLVRSKRVNIFRGVNAGTPRLEWKYKNDMVWINDCKLPVGEDFMRLPVDLFSY